MDIKPVLRDTYAVKEHHGSFYTAGPPVRPASDGRHVFCVYGENVNVVELSTGKIPFYLPGDGETITAMDFHPATNQIVFASQSQLLYHWKPNENFQLLLSAGANGHGEPQAMQVDDEQASRKPREGAAMPSCTNLPWQLHKRWKAHLRPITDISIDSTGSYLATASIDGTVRVWDLAQGYCTHSFKGHDGLVTLARFHPDPQRLQLVTGGNDATVRVWDLVSKSCKVLESHMGAITSVEFLENGWTLVSGGRDKVMSVWDLRSFELTKTIPTFESIEGLLKAPKKMAEALGNDGKADRYVLTCGEKGLLRAWDCVSGDCVSQEEKSDLNVGFQQLLPWRTEEDEEVEKLLLVTEDSCFVSYDAALPLQRTNFVVGFYDEILGLKFVLKDKEILMNATSERLLMFNRATFACTALTGHQEVIMSIDRSSDSMLAVSGAKDKTARVWDLQQKRCLAVCTGHTEAVTAVAFSRKSRSFVVTGSADKTIKFWDISAATKGAAKDVVECHARRTIKAHDKEINSVAVAPNDALIATGSQDKMVKLWDAESLKLLGTMKGHKRGVWCVAFSTKDKCVASASADKTIKIWSLADFSCLRTLEGHTGSVLSLSFLSCGMQLVSTGSEGMIKLWTIRSSECVNTFENHYDRVWTVAVREDGEEFASAGADSVLNIYEDVTDTVAEEREKQKEETILQEQELSNHLRAKEYRKALRIAFHLDQPFRIRRVLEEIMEEGDEEALRDIVAAFSPDHLEKCLRYIRDWNTNAKHSHVAQTILNRILAAFKPKDIMDMPNFKDLLLGLIPYTERHASRMDLLLQKSYLLDYTLHRMNQLVPQEEGDEEMPTAAPVTARVKKTRKRVAKADVPNGSAAQAMAMSDVSEESEESEESEGDGGGSSSSSDDENGWIGGDDDLPEGFGGWLTPTATVEETKKKEKATKASKRVAKAKAKEDAEKVEKAGRDAAAEKKLMSKEERKEKKQKRKQLKRKMDPASTPEAPPAKKFKATPKKGKKAGRT